MQFEAALSSVTMPGDSEKPITVKLVVHPRFRDEMSDLGRNFAGDPDDGPTMTIDVTGRQVRMEFGKPAVNRETGEVLN